MLLCAYGDDGGVGPTLHCEGLDGAVVDVEGVERPHCDLGGVGICGQLEQSAGLPLSDIDPVLSYDAIHLQWGAPVQEDVGGVKGVASGVEWVATRSCCIIHKYRDTNTSIRYIVVINYSGSDILISGILGTCMYRGGGVWLSLS